MKILVACEFSQVVTKAFRDKGHNAWSCDILPTEGNPDYHIKDDVLNHLNDGWDMMIGHPECTFMCNSGVHHLHKDESRWEKLDSACEFFNRLKSAPINKICLENPIPHKYAKEDIGNYTQLIQPYMFGEPKSKATCLWLKNLPKLQPTNNVKEAMKNLPKIESQSNFYSSIKDRWKHRSRTFQCFADAMADQWGDKPKQLVL